MTVMGMCSRLRCPRVDVVADDYLVAGGKLGLGRLASILGLPVATLRAKLSRAQRLRATRVPGRAEPSRHKVAALDLPYVSFIPDVARTDPDGDLFSPVLGIVGFGGRGSLRARVHGELAPSRDRRAQK